jgi:hypothetical protein
MTATVASTPGKKGEVVGVAAVVEDVVAAAAVRVDLSVDGVLVVVRAGSAQEAATAATSRSSIRPMSRPFLTTEAYSGRQTCGPAASPILAASPETALGAARHGDRCPNCPTSKRILRL